jgi:hypothetical protein
MRNASWIAAAALLLCACSSLSSVVAREPVPPGAQVAVIPFRDCLIADQEGCSGSGNKAGNVFAAALGQRYKIVLLSRPVGATDRLADADAIALARQRGAMYVVNGEVEEYYDVASFTFRTDRAGVSVRVLRIKDGSVSASYSQTMKANSNLGSPDDIVRSMAEHVRDAVK